jgi:hypothetical protein
LSDESKQTEYNRNWRNKNKDRQRYLSKRSTARSFINKDADSADLINLSNLINDRWKKMNRYEKLNVLNSTLFDWEGKELRTLENPYIDGEQGQRPYYRAIALDAEENEHEVIWDVFDGWEDITDESSICDWDNPISVTKL